MSHVFFFFIEQHSSIRIKQIYFLVIYLKIQNSKKIPRLYTFTKFYGNLSVNIDSTQVKNTIVCKYLCTKNKFNWTNSGLEKLSSSLQVGI